MVVKVGLLVTIAVVKVALSSELINSLEEYNLANGGKLYDKPEMQNLYGFIYDIRNASEHIEEKAATEKLENMQAAYKDANLKTKAFNDSANAIADNCNKKQIPKEYIGADNTEIKNSLSKASELNNVKAEINKKIDFLHNTQNQISEANVAQRENGEEYRFIPEYFKNKEKLSELTEKLNECGRKDKGRAWTFRKVFR